MAKKNLKLVKRWVEALESGEYKQAKHRLKTANQHGQYFCCLGVLRELEPKIHHDYDNSLDNDDFVAYINKPAGCNLDQGRLADMNDSGSTFSQIAQHIREEVGIPKKAKKVK